MPEFQDKEMQCVDCGKSFTDRAKDQTFRYKNGWIGKDGELTPLKRCFDCRQKKKQQRSVEGGEEHGRKPKGYR